MQSQHHPTPNASEEQDHLCAKLTQAVRAVLKALEYLGLYYCSACDNFVRERGKHGICTTCEGGFVEWALETYSDERGEPERWAD